MSDKIEDGLEKITTKEMSLILQPQLSEPISVLDNVGFFKVSEKSLDWYEEGVRLYKKNQFDEAILAFNRAKEDEVSFPQAWNNIGVCQIKIGNKKKALKAFSEAAYLKEQVLYLDNLALIYTELGKHSKALDVCEKIIEKHPYSNHAAKIRRYNLEQIAKNEKQGFWSDKRKTIALFGGGAIGVIASIIIMYYGTRNPNATSDYNVSLQPRTDTITVDDSGPPLNENPEGPGVDLVQGMFDMGRDYLESNNIEKAVETYEMFTNLYPMSFQGWNNLAISYKRSGRDLDAINAYEKSLEQNPNSIGVLISAAGLYHDQKEYKKSLELVNRVIELDPSNGDALDCRADLNRHINEEETKN